MAACSLWKEGLGGIFILEIGGTQSAEGLKLWGRAAGLMKISLGAHSYLRGWGQGLSFSQTFPSLEKEAASFTSCL